MEQKNMPERTQSISNLAKKFDQRVDLFNRYLATGIQFLYIIK